MEDSKILLKYNGKLTNKNYIEQFENELKNKFKSKYAVACSSGTSAIHASLIAMGVKEGDEVIVPNLTVIMTVMPILYLGAIPVFVDCQKNLIDFDYEDLRKKITNKTKVIIPVYMWGISYDMNKLKELTKKRKIKILEYACQAQGSKWGDKYLGTIGDIGCFSLKDGKIISSEEGGYILTNKKCYYDKIKNIINHQIRQNPKLSFKDVGYNYRITNIQAFLALKSLKNMDKSLKNRKKIYDYIISNLKNKNIKILKSKYTYNYFSLAIIFDKKIKKQCVKLSEKGIVNSVGTFGLKSCSKRLSIIKYFKIKKICIKTKTKNCDYILDRILAINISNKTKIEEAQKIVTEIENIIGD